MINAESISEEETAALPFEELTEAVCARLAQNQRVRRNLPGEGRVRIDRQLPFLCIYRSPDEPDAGTRELVTTEAAYLFADGSKKHHEGLSHLCRQLSTLMLEHYGAFLFLEIWSRREADRSENGSEDSLFTIVSAEEDPLPTTIAAFQEALAEIQMNRSAGGVSTSVRREAGAPGLPSLLPVCDGSRRGGCCVLGLEVEPIYRDSTSGNLFPMILFRLRQQLSVAMRKTFAQFTGTEEDVSGPAGEPREVDANSFHALGPSSLVKAARLVDQQLCEVSESFDFLLQVTPTNAADCEQQFRQSRFKKMPQFTYRPLPYHPSILKRRLFDIEIERIEDPTLSQLFWEKQEEIDRQLSALRDLDTPEFLYTSLQLYGDASESLLQLASGILHRFPQPEPRSSHKKCVSSKKLVELARHEIDYYHTRMSEFNAKVELCDEIGAGMMVSQDRLLIAGNVNLAPRRVRPLLHHEIGTHLLTYFNGRCQPLRQLYAGLSGYEELQEGLAVLAEYLTGGLTVNRVRTLAGRVIAVGAMTSGRSFAETFSLLHKNHGFKRKRSFSITLRVFRGGGFTKDVIYLRGLRDLLEYLAAGHDIEPLYVGKIGLHHVPHVQEMRRRNIIVAPRILPRFWDDETIRDKLAACREKSVLQLLECCE